MLFLFKMVTGGNLEFDLKTNIRQQKWNQEDWNLQKSRALLLSTVKNIEYEIFNIFKMAAGYL